MTKQKCGNQELIRLCMKTPLILLLLLSCAPPLVSIHGAEMTPEQAGRLLTRLGTWPPPTYITPAQAAAIFHFHGKVTVEEYTMVGNTRRFGDTKRLSTIFIQPVDNSFDHISIFINKGDAEFRETGALLARVPKNQIPATSFIKFSDGTRGYFYDFSHFVLSSPDRVEIGLVEDRGDPVITASNKEMVNAFLDKNDNGLKAMTDVMKIIYPLAKRKYEEQMADLASLKEAEKLSGQYDSSKGLTSGTSTAPSSSPPPSAPTPSPAISP